MMKKNFSERNWEAVKLENNQNFLLKRFDSRGTKLNLKRKTTRDMLPFGDIEAANIRMYETHVPGFCYLRNGECRKRTMSAISSTRPDPVECSEKVKAILFTNNELDVCKTLCLHLLGTQVQSRSHIQRKDGRLCSYIKAQTIGNIPYTLHPFSQRIANKVVSKFEKMLPRYVLDVKHLSRGVSSSSVKTYDFESGSDEETKKKRKIQVPIYINNEINIIIQSVMEALEAVNSPKLNALINMASSPEELRNMLKNEDLRDFIIELSSNPLILRPTSYDFVMTHLMFDKIPKKGTLESVAQVLEIGDNVELYRSLHQIQKGLFQRHKELAESNILPKIKPGIQDKAYTETNKILNSSANASFKTVDISNATSVSKKECKEIVQKVGRQNGQEDKMLKNVNSQELKTLKFNFSNNSSLKNVSINLENAYKEEYNNLKDTMMVSDENSLTEENRGSFQQIRSNSIESNKYSFQNLSNPQRILFGLKVASLKSKPINMHQLEGKKKLDLNAILAPILYAQESDADIKQYLLQTPTSSFNDPAIKLKKSSTNILEIHTSNLENLSRALLTNLRLDISESENKKRVNQFMATIS